MEYTTLGKTNIKVSRLGFGGAPAGLTNYLGKYSPRSPNQRKQVISAIHKAVDLGINYFDTAAAYGDGESELIFGEGLREHRQKVFLATKIGSWSDVNVRQNLDESLKRLQVDYVDLVQIHGDTYSEEQVHQITGKGGILEVLEAYRDFGKIRFLGFTTEDVNPPVYDFIASGRFDMIQVCYNLIYQHPAEPTRPFGVIYQAEKQGMGIAVMRSMTSGIFQRWIQWVNPDNQFDYSPALLHFVLSNPMVDVALVGMRTVDEVERNVRICMNQEGRIDIPKLHNRYVNPDET
jgi:aryl-alcohol dehydrogenase-like predicted oxidoreductase